MNGTFSRFIIGLVDGTVIQVDYDDYDKAFREMRDIRDMSPRRDMMVDLTAPGFDEFLISIDAIAYMTIKTVVDDGVHDDISSSCARITPPSAKGVKISGGA